MTYESVVRVQSRSAAGVEFTVRRMSFARRMELMRAVRGLAEKVEFLEAASGASEKMDAALIWGEIDRLYVRWGLVEVTGLEIDGAPATPESLVESGPEGVFREALAAVKSQISLTEAETKN